MQNWTWEKSTLYIKRLMLTQKTEAQFLLCFMYLLFPESINKFPTMTKTSYDGNILKNINS